MVERIRFQLLGTPCWQADGGRMWPLKEKDAAWVAGIACGERSRAALAQRIWSGSKESRLETLRKRIQRLRAKTGHPLIGEGQAEFLPGVECDLQAMLSDWPSDQLIARGIFMDGISPPTKLAQWLADQRRHWGRQIALILVSRARLRAGEPPVPDAMRMLVRATELAPDLESAWIARMELHLRDNDPASATAAYARLALELARAGAVPGPAARAIQERMRHVGSTHADVLRHPPELIGRERIERELDDLWRHRQPFLLCGPGRIGKSRLLSEFAARHGAPVVCARPRDGEAPYTTLALLLREVMKRYAIEPDAALSRRLAPVLPELRHLAIAGPVEAVDVVDAAEAVLSESARRGLQGVVVDDMHHADPPSVLAFQRLTLSGSKPTLGFGFAMRQASDPVLEQVIDHWRTESTPLHHIDLQPFTPEEIARLIETLSLGCQVPAPARIHDRVGGRPGFVLDLLRQVLQAPNALQSTSLPASAVSLQQAALMELPRRWIELLQLHALLGLDISRAARELDWLDGELQEAVAALESLHLLHHGRIASELVHEALQASQTADERVRCSALAAAALEADPQVPRSPVASLWAAAQQWTRAADAYRIAAADARRAGEFSTSCSMAERAATCCRRAGDVHTEFEVLHESFEVALYAGPSEAQKIVDRLQALASSDAQRARAALAQAEVRLAEHGHEGQALTAAQTAARLAEPFAELRDEALAALSSGYAQIGEFDSAIALGERAITALLAAGRRRKAIETRANMTYTYHAACRFDAASDSAQRAMLEYESEGDGASAAIVGGNLASLHMLSGDPEAAIAPALRAFQRHCRVDRSASAHHAIVNRATLCWAYGYAGRFKEALQVLDLPAPVWQGLPPAIDARARLSMTTLLLRLGQREQGLAMLGQACESWPPAAQIQRCWCLVQAAAIVGQRADDQLQRIDTLQRAHWDLPLALSPWLEWARQGPPSEAIAQLERIHRAYTEAGMSGKARTARLRQIQRWSEVPGDEAKDRAATLARELQSELGRGLQALEYLPDAWSSLAGALQRVGDDVAARACRAAAIHWIEKVALPRVPSHLRSSFRLANPINRALLNAQAG